jgi:branched-chain amino acid aminotransferase
MTTDTTIDVMPDGPPAPDAPFGTVFGPAMAVSRFDGARWSAPSVVSSNELALHPGAHALHYGSACFEGLKAHRHPDGRVVAFRADRHTERLRQSAERLHLPVPPTDLVERLLDSAIDANEAVAPVPPGSLYLRPTLLGTDITIGSAAAPSLTAILYVLACPVGDYLPPRPLTLVVETETPRTTPQFGVVKAGANYAMALSPIMEAREQWDADQVLFAPGGRLEETGASNVLLLDGHHVLTPELTDAYLHGVTRDSLLQLAGRRGWQVEERHITVDECLEWIARPTAELALSGTAAVVATVGTLIVDDVSHTVGTPGEAPRTEELRNALIDIQTGRVAFDW